MTRARAKLTGLVVLIATAVLATPLIVAPALHRLPTAAARARALPEHPEPAAP